MVTWVQKRPTPPEAAVMRMLSFGPDPSSLSPTSWMALWSDVMAATGRDAASTAVTLAGLFTVDVTGARAYSANPPPLYTGKPVIVCVLQFLPNPDNLKLQRFRLL